MTRLENELERVLRSAEESAPRPDPDLMRQIDERGRRRRLRVRSAAASLAAVAAISVVSVASGAVRPPALDPADSPRNSDNTLETRVYTPGPGPVRRGPAQSESSGLPLAEKLWPAAVHRIPRKLPDGRKLFPRTFLDARTLLITTESSFEKSDALYRYDLETKATEEIAAVSSPGYANDFTVSDGWIVWWANVAKPATPGTEIWGVPLTGGDARRLAVAPGKGPDFLAVGGGEVHWSYNGTDSAVYSAPLSGEGEPRAIPNSEGFHIVSWPWIGSPGQELGSRSIDDNEQEILYRTLRNVETGETRTSSALKGTWTCGISWCVGTSDDTSYASRRDGSGRRELHGVSTRYEFSMVPMPVRDRFLVGGTYVVDLHTGKAGQLAHTNEGTRIPVSDRLHYSYVKDGYEVIDLAAVN